MKKVLTGILLLSILLCPACSSPQGAPSSASPSTGSAVSSGAMPMPESSAGSSPGQATQTELPDSNKPASQPEPGKTTASSKPPASSSGGGFNWSGTKLLLNEPAHGELSTTKPLFRWSNIAADSFTFYLEEKSGDSYKQIKKVDKLKDSQYQLDVSLKAGGTYRWYVTANNGGKIVQHSGSTEKGAVFMTTINPKTHPANVGRDYSFDGKISEQVLKNYLSRSITLSMLSSSPDSLQSDARFVLNTGAKYISRSIIPWQPETEYTNSIAGYKKKIDEMHALDPDLIFEACIFETVWKSCEETPIPAWVFEAFGKKAENRNFDYEKMLFPDGRYVDHWESGCSVPDITQLETQMYFYYRACKYIDAGFEAIHWGQVYLVGESDKALGYANYQKVLTMVRQYAKTHARRHFLLNNAHVHGIIGPDGKLLFDFHAFPFRGKVPDGEVKHAPSEDNPQKVILEVGNLDSLYKKSLGGTTVSGWSCESLPYVVELDNGGGYEQGYLNDPTRDYWIWGMDEISWFANQPQSYRAYWLDYAYNWIRQTDPQGSLMMPGSRPAYLQKENAMSWYYANSREFTTYGWGDEEAIRSVWVDSNT